MEKGEIDRAQVDASVRRILTAKAQIGLTRDRMVGLDKLPTLVGTRANAAVADDVSRQSITLIKDERKQVPLRVSREARSSISRSSTIRPGGRSRRRAAPSSRSWRSAGRRRRPSSCPTAPHRASWSSFASWPPGSTPSSSARSCGRRRSAAAWISRRRWCGCSDQLANRRNSGRSRSWRCCSATPMRRRSSASCRRCC